MPSEKDKQKLQELAKKSQDEQINFFIRAFGTSEITATALADIAKKFDAITGKQGATEIEEPQALK